MTGPLDHELKLQRAFKHLQDLGTKTKAWLDAGNYSLRYEFDPDATMWDGKPDEFNANVGGNYMLAGTVWLSDSAPHELPAESEMGKGVMTAYATATQQPPTDPLSLLIGDALHNMRSGLDALAYALTIAHTNLLTQEMIDRSEFPIFGDEDRKGTPGAGPGLFQNNGGIKISGWHPDAKTAVELLQPYKRGNDYRSDPLWILHKLDNVSKHRLLHTTISAFAGTLWDTPRFENVLGMGPGVIQSFHGAVNADTPIARICGLHPIVPDREMKVEIHPAMDIAFSEQAPVAANEPVLVTLGAIYGHIRDEVMPNLTPFL